MNSSTEIMRKLEDKRASLNDRLMNARDRKEANSIERELWAVRAAIRHHKAMLQERKSGTTNEEGSDSKLRGSDHFSSQR
jgi:hypothetical protein